MGELQRTGLRPAAERQYLWAYKQRIDSGAEMSDPTNDVDDLHSSTLAGQPRTVPVILASQLPPAEICAALEWLEETFGKEWISAQVAEAATIRPADDDAAHPVGSLVRALERTIAAAPGVVMPFDLQAVSKGVEFAQAVKLVSPSPAWRSEMRRRVRADKNAFSKCLAELRVAACFKYLGHEVHLREADAAVRSCDIRLGSAGTIVADVECKAQEPSSASDRSNFRILLRIAEQATATFKERGVIGIRLVIAATRDLIRGDVDAVSSRIRELNFEAPGVERSESSDISLEVIPVAPFDLEIQVDERMPLGDSHWLQQEAAKTLWMRWEDRETFQSATAFRASYNKFDKQTALVKVAAFHRVELRLGKYPDRVACILQHMEKAASQVTGDVPAVMYEEWRTPQTPLRDDFDRACDLARSAIGDYPSLSVVVVYRPISSPMRRFEFISNDKATHPFPKGFVFARP